MNATDPNLTALLEREAVLCHPFVIGEVACGHLRNRDEVLAELRKLDSAVRVTDDEVLHLIERSRAFGKGLGFIDVHLVASALVTGAALWTRDRALLSVAKELEAAYEG